MYGPQEKQHSTFIYSEDQRHKTFNKEQLGENKVYIFPHWKTLGEKKTTAENIIGKDNRKYHIKLICFMGNIAIQCGLGD